MSIRPPSTTGAGGSRLPTPSSTSSTATPKRPTPGTSASTASKPKVSPGPVTLSAVPKSASTTPARTVAKPAPATPARPAPTSTDDDDFLLSPQRTEDLVDEVSSATMRSIGNVSSPSASSSSSSSAYTTSIPLSTSIKTETEVQVAVRVRPLNGLELSTGQKFAWNCSHEQGGFKGTITQIQSNHAAQVAANNSSKLDSTDKSFTFDHLFTPEDSNSTLFSVLGQQLITQAMNGYHSMLFAYGQTSSGKTHSIHGSQGDPGAIPLAVQAIFDWIAASEGREYVLRCNYLEVYNEIINDLLNPLATNLNIRESPTKGVFVEGMKESVVVSPDQVFALLSSGESQRHVGRTNYNEQSSRSHTIFQMTIESTSAYEEGQPQGKKKKVRSAVLSLVDLAGSESALKAGSNSRVKETGYINRSLLTLSHVIYKLSEASTAGKSPGHIPFRDSKLTRLLQMSLSGVACVSVVCTISPSTSNIEETISTLKFARRAKKIKTHATANEVNDSSSLLIAKYREEIAKLKEELAAYKSMPRPLAAAETDTSSNTSTSETGAENSDDEEDAAYAASMKMSNEPTLSPAHQEAETALTSQIEALTRLILTSSQVPRPGEARPDGTIVQQPQPNAAIMPSNLIGSRSTSGSTVTSGNNSAASSRLNSASHHARRVSVNNLLDAVAANSSSPSTPLLDSTASPATSTLPLDISSAAAAHPAGADPFYYPTQLNPLHTWTRAQLEAQYISLLARYDEQLKIIAKSTAAEGGTK